MSGRVLNTPLPTVAEVKVVVGELAIYNRNYSFNPEIIFDTNGYFHLGFGDGMSRDFS